MAQYEVLTYDVVIVGAGPAGCACALALKDSGLKVALLDKHTFPRDKVCGDAIPGRAIKVLGSIDPQFSALFGAFPDKSATRSATVYYKNKTLTFNWVLAAYTCARIHFDNFLVSLVKENTRADVHTNMQADVITVEDDGISLTIKNNRVIFKSKMIVGADGAHSVVAKQLANNTLDRKHHIGSVRAYFSNISGLAGDNVEVYFDKQYLPSYLWVFPLPGNMANVGFGMRSDVIAGRKINIKKVFYEFIERSPVLKEKFGTAQQLGELEGFGLPLGSRVGTLSGNRFMLAGDAASLIDPITGDGIGNAMLSGKLAAEQIMKCFAQQDFTSGFMKTYDKALMARLGRELRLHYNAQRILAQAPFLLDMIFAAGQNKAIKNLVQKWL